MMKKSFKINGKKEYLIEFENAEIFVNGEKWNGSISKTDTSSFLLSNENNSTSSEITEADDKSFEVKVGHYYHNLDIKDDLDLLIEKMGFASSLKQKDDQIKAPMPGLIKEVDVNVGDEVKAGQMLLILEAMKMENSIKASHDGIIKEISVQPGQNVEKNQILIKY